MLMIPLLVLAAGSCSRLEDDDDGNNPYRPLSLSTKQTGYVSAGMDFSYRFLEKVDAKTTLEGHDSWFVSPLSLQIALGMLLNGAQGVTAAEICRTLGYGDGETAEINGYCRLMLEQLPKLDKKTELSLANAIFYRKDISLKTPFKNAVSDNYHATLEAMDFSKSAAAVKTINNWCGKQTKGMIPKVLDNVSPDATAYLINALYFKSKWAEQFSKGDTGKETFTDEEGRTLKVDMMKMDDKSFAYNENGICQAVRLPYGNGAYAMTVIHPKAGHTVSELLSSPEEIPSPAHRATVDLWLPRFEMKYHVLLNDILRGMGMHTSFDPLAADFLAMSDIPSYVDFVQQDAVIKVDEQGTEAAAVTVIGMRETAMPMPPEKVVFHADRPFLFLISEQSTGAILFAGKYSGK